jgi:hypothetical protein
MIYNLHGGNKMNIKNERGKRAERLVCSILEELSREKIISGFKDVADRNSSPDFEVSKLDGAVLALEVKSSFVGLKKHYKRYPDIPVIIVYPYWEIHPKFRKFSADETREDVKKQILSLLS